MNNSVSIERIRKLAETGESDTLEFWSTLDNQRKALKTVCALLNQQGGQVLFGVTQDGRVPGLQKSEFSIDDLHAELAKFDPPVFPRIERAPVAEDREAIVISVGRDFIGPFMYRGKSYQRVGKSTVKMRAHEYRQMHIECLFRDDSWESQPAEGWSIEDLDGEQIRITAEQAIEIGRLEDLDSGESEDLLQALGLFQDGILLRAAVVLFGNADRIKSEFPQCHLRLARFREFDWMDTRDSRQVHGNIFSLYEAAQQFLHDETPIASRFEEGRIERIDEPLYPVLATREALLNAFCHRDYSIDGGSVGLEIYDDCVEVISTGALPFRLTPESLFAPHESIPRNPLIADTLNRGGTIERWGRGTLEIVQDALAANLEQPEFEDEDGSVTVRFRHNNPKYGVRRIWL